MGWTITYLVLGIILSVFAGVFLVKDKKGSNKGYLFPFLLCFAFGILFAYWGLESYGKSCNEIPNGLPSELTDGQYKIQPLDRFKDKEGKIWIAVHVLEEAGKTIDGLKPYRKIAHSKFGSNNVVIGRPMTITQKTHKEYQELIINKEW